MHNPKLTRAFAVRIHKLLMPMKIVDQNFDTEFLLLAPIIFQLSLSFKKIGYNIIVL